MFEFGILGGGLAGWSLARALLDLGVPAQDICLFEKHSSTSGSSGVLWGLMHPFTGRTLYPKEGYLDYWRYSLNWLKQQQAQSPDLLVRETPLWRVAFSEKVERQFARSYARAKDMPGYPLKQIDSTNLPVVGARSAYEVTTAAHACVPQLVAHLAQNSAITKKYFQTQLQPQRHPEGWQFGSSEGSVCRNLILAPGNGLQDLFPQLVMSYKRGEVAIYDLEGQLPAAISGEGRYIASIGANRHIVGATFYVGQRAWSAAQSWRDLKERLPWLPEIQQAQLLQLWTGIRAITPDKEPIIGEIEDGLWIHSGFATRGLLMIPQCSQWLAEALVNKSNPLPQRVLPSRFKDTFFAFNPAPNP